MGLILENPGREAERIEYFIRSVYKKNGFKNAVIAVSGGIDSAVVCTLLCRALGSETVFPLSLPYGEQSTEDAKTICEFNKIPAGNWQEQNIKNAVDILINDLDTVGDRFRSGNIMARVRMVAVFDKAKKISALVAGTENRSEKYLGYFTRFGDAASDLEPIEHLYKTQVRQLAQFLGLPSAVLDKQPSAELWPGQTDESEFGFSYKDADLVMEKYIDEKQPAAEIKSAPEEVVRQVIARIESQKFKHMVPYRLINSLDL